MPGSGIDGSGGRGMASRRVPPSSPWRSAFDLVERCMPQQQGTGVGCSPRHDLRPRVSCRPRPRPTWSLRGMGREPISENQDFRTVVPQRVIDPAMLDYMSFHERLRNLRETEYFLSQSVETRKVYSCMWENPDVDLQSDVQMIELIDWCFEKRCYNTAMAVTLHEHREHKTVQVVKRLPDQEQDFWDGWMPSLMHRNEYTAIRIIVSKFMRHQFSKFLHGFVNPNAVNEYLKSDLMKRDAAARALLNHCSNADIPELTEVIRQICTKEDNHFLELMVNSSNKHVLYAIQYVLGSNDHSSSTVKLGCSFMPVACKTGLSTVVARHLSDSELHRLSTRAVKTNQLPVVQTLRDVGLMSNHSAFELSKTQSSEVRKEEERIKGLPDLPDTRSRVEALKRAKEVAGFLSSKASEPRSLESQCFLEVSKHLGWGPARGRDANALPPPLPTPFKKKLKNCCVEEKESRKQCDMKLKALGLPV